MTGYASKAFEYQGFNILIEIKSLNNKFLDVRFRLPSSLGFAGPGPVIATKGTSSSKGVTQQQGISTPGSLEWRLRRIIKRHINRGKIDVYISLTAEEDYEFTMIKSMIDRR
jgi:uncharacterized protein YicC (UPF0701 family)